jgi:hypothetical protein
MTPAPFEQARQGRVRPPVGQAHRRTPTADHADGHEGGGGLSGTLEEHVALSGHGSRSDATGPDSTPAAPIRQWTAAWTAPTAPTARGGEAPGGGSRQAGPDAGPRGAGLSCARDHDRRQSTPEPAGRGSDPEVGGCPCYAGRARDHRCPPGRDRLPEGAVRMPAAPHGPGLDPVRSSRSSRGNPPGTATCPLRGSRESRPAEPDDIVETTSITIKLNQIRSAVISDTQRDLPTRPG